MNTSLARVLEFKIPADVRYVAIIRRGVRNLAESVGFAREEVADVEVAVSEAVTNSVVHGSPNKDCAEVLVKCSASGDCLVVEVEDQSQADCLPMHPSPCDLAKEGGRGMTMMRALMDVCEDSRTETGIRVRMSKQRVR